MATQENIKLIQQQIKEIKDLTELNKEHPKFKDWLEQTIAVIKGIENCTPVKMSLCNNSHFFKKSPNNIILIISAFSWLYNLFFKIY